MRPTIAEPEARWQPAPYAVIPLALAGQDGEWLGRLDEARREFQMLKLHGVSLGNRLHTGTGCTKRNKKSQINLQQVASRIVSQQRGGVCCLSGRQNRKRHATRGRTQLFVVEHSTKLWVFPKNHRPGKHFADDMEEDPAFSSAIHNFVGVKMGWMFYINSESLDLSLELKW